MAESITEGTLKTWSKQVGDSVAADEEVATIETDKARTHCPTSIPQLFA
jgi:2-oxoglutarate dehydrogenase E2 component (dihydrolipoamide succinyltransferase)